MSDELEEIKRLRTDVDAAHAEIERLETTIINMIEEMRDQSINNHKLLMSKFDELAVDSARKEGYEAGKSDAKKQVVKEIAQWSGLLTLAVGVVGAIFYVAKLGN